MLQHVTAHHLTRLACLYVRQSTLQQVIENTESTSRQYGVIPFFRPLFPVKVPGRSGTRLNEASSPDTEQQRG
jgi:hypothetical protein